MLAHKFIQYQCTHTLTHTGLTIVGAQGSGWDAVGPYGMMNSRSIHHSSLSRLLQQLCQGPGGRKIKHTLKCRLHLNWKADAKPNKMSTNNSKLTQRNERGQKRKRYGDLKGKQEFGGIKRDDKRPGKNAHFHVGIIIKPNIIICKQPAS